ncbi:hypothetical protein [Enterobacter mori]
MAGNKLLLPGKADNFLTASINGAAFSATITGGRYDEDPKGETEWIRRTWGRGPLSAADEKHILFFISINWDITGEQTYNLSDGALPVSIGFTNLFPTEDGNEFDYIVTVKTGLLTITHSAETFIAEGRFSFDVDVPQSDGPPVHFTVTDGQFWVGPTQK